MDKKYQLTNLVYHLDYLNSRFKYSCQNCTNIIYELDEDSEDLFKEIDELCKIAIDLDSRIKEIKNLLNIV